MLWYTDTMINDEMDLAYAAGLFDGEGCVSINKVKAHRNPSLKPGFQLRCSISITNEWIANWFQECFGGYVMLRKRARAQDYWQWVVTSNNAYEFLKALKGYLKIKHEQAIIGIAFTEYRKTMSHINKTETYWNQNFKYYEEIRRLNARWGTEYYEGT
ncbi:LAGLIDADG endonuclease [Streptomyces phage Kenrey]|nr:LAGLIDADG endonuclease [Streptomyces phage Kenrey]